MFKIKSKKQKSAVDEASETPEVEAQPTEEAEQPSAPEEEIPPPPADADPATSAATTQSEAERVAAAHCAHCGQELCKCAEQIATHGHVLE